MNHPLVVHKNRPHDVYIGRPSIWGNPFVVGRDGSRLQVIERYRAWLFEHRPDLVTKARTELKGKVLGCWCAPLPCHGDILAEIANGDSRLESQVAS